MQLHSQSCNNINNITSTSANKVVVVVITLKSLVHQEPCVRNTFSFQTNYEQIRRFATSPRWDANLVKPKEGDVQFKKEIDPPMLMNLESLLSRDS